MAEGREASVAAAFEANDELRALHGLRGEVEAIEVEAVEAQGGEPPPLPPPRPPPQLPPQPQHGPIDSEVQLVRAWGSELRVQAALGARLAAACEELQERAARSEAWHSQHVQKLQALHSRGVLPRTTLEDAAEVSAAATSQHASLHALAGAVASWVATRPHAHSQPRRGSKVDMLSTPFEDGLSTETRLRS
mgnify:CR=1 FL=1